MRSLAFDARLPLRLVPGAPTLVLNARRSTAAAVDMSRPDAIVPWLCIYKAKASREGERCAFHDWC